MHGTVSVTANASDDVGVTGVQFRLDNADLGGEDTSSALRGRAGTRRPRAPGSHTLTAIARDAAGNKTTATERDGDG